MRNELIETTDERRWRKYLPVNRAVFGSVEFMRIVEHFSGNKARLFTLATQDGTVAYPFHLRSISRLPFASRLQATYFDTVTPEYTGPIGTLRLNSHLFAGAVHELFRELGVIAEFIHLNPWSDWAGLLDPRSLRFNREIVWVDVTLSNEELWRNHFSHACRKDINRAGRENVRIIEAQGPADIREFHRIYIATMNRNQASAAYFFPLEYFQLLFEDLRENARFVLAEHRGDIVAATLYLHDDENVYSYLGGADYQFQQLRPTNAIVYNTISWARARGKRRLVLGGGYHPDDGILRFKSSFSSLRAPFHTYCCVHREDVYLTVEQEWRGYYKADLANAGYFPSYRSDPSSEFLSERSQDANSERRVSRQKEATMNIPLSLPQVTDEDRLAVQEVLKGTELSLGPRIPAFEAAVAEYVGSRFAVAVNSGTSGLHLCMKAAGIRPGDEVITTSFSFVASANCILFEGGVPVFVDIDPRSCNLDPSRIESAITPRTRAILPVHVFGRPCRMREIMAIAKRHNLLVIEDSCEALGAIYEGGKTGTFGQTGVYAFYPNKQMTTGEGGMIVTDEAAIASLCRSWRNQGRSEESAWPLHERLGYNYRLSDIHCALGISQLRRIAQTLDQRARVAALYDQALSSMAEVIRPELQEQGARISWFVYVVRLQSEFTREHRDALLRELRGCGIGCSNYFSAIHLQPFYRRSFAFKEGDLPVTEQIANRSLALPFFNALSEAEVDCVSQTLRKALSTLRLRNLVAVAA